MKEAFKKALTDALREDLPKVREASIFTDKGRIFLDAAALDYGAAVNSDNQIIKEDGTVMSEKDPDYKNIVEAAKKQARHCQMPMAHTRSRRLISQNPEPHYPAEY